MRDAGNPANEPKPLAKGLRAAVTGGDRPERPHGVDSGRSASGELIRKSAIRLPAWPKRKVRCQAEAAECGHSSDNDRASHFSLTTRFRASCKLPHVGKLLQ